MKLNKHFFMDFTYNKLRHCSTCSIYQVGATIVRDHRIISHGYNGAPSGFIECAEIDEVLKAARNLDLSFSLDEDINNLKRHVKGTTLEVTISRLQKKYKEPMNMQTLLNSLKFNENIVHSAYEIHAEQNAIAYAFRYGQSLDGAELYVSIEPCLECAKTIIAAGIKKVYFRNKYRDKRFDKYSSKFLEQNGIYVEQLSV